MYLTVFVQRIYIWNENLSMVSDRRPYSNKIKDIRKCFSGFEGGGVICSSMVTRQAHFIISAIHQVESRIEFIVKKLNWHQRINYMLLIFDVYYRWFTLINSIIPVLFTQQKISTLIHKWVLTNLFSLNCSSNTRSIILYNNNHNR